MILKRVLWISGVLTVILTLGSIYYMSPKISLSLLGGSVIGAANFYLLTRAVQALLGGGAASKRRLAALFFFKLVALAGIFVIILKLPIHTVAFLVGLSTIVVAVTIGGLLPNGKAT